jgi:integrase
MGWLSDGWKLFKVRKILTDLQVNHDTGSGPQTWAAMKAQEEEERKRQELEQKALEKSRVTLAEYWVASYFPYAQRTKTKSFQTEEFHFNTWLKPQLGDTPLKEIEIKEWDCLVTTLTKAGKAQRTVEYVTGTLRRIVKHAYERGIVPAPPPSAKRIGATSPKDNGRKRIITPEEAKAILEELQRINPFAYRFTLFAFLTGCRASEARKLQWMDVDLGKGAVSFRETKNGTTRPLPVEGDLKELLESMEPGGPTDPVFPQKDGRPYGETPSTFRHVVNHGLDLNQGRERADKICFHSIRHTVATALAQSLDVRTLMDLAGWKTVQMAARYIHANQDAKRRAMKGLGASVLEPDQEGKVIQFPETRKKAN